MLCPRTIPPSNSASLFSSQVWENSVNQGHPGQEHQPVQRYVTKVTVSQMAPYSLGSALLLTRALCREWGAIWDEPCVSHREPCVCHRPRRSDHSSKQMLSKEAFGAKPWHEHRPQSRKHLHVANQRFSSYR
jgi:hypothetical protein